MELFQWCAQHVAVMGSISLFIVAVFFIGSLIWALKLDSGYKRRMKNLPLDHSEFSLGEEENNGR